MKMPPKPSRKSKKPAPVAAADAKATDAEHPTPVRQKRRPLIDAVMHAAGWAHDIFTLALAIVDVVSDILVAWQFWGEGHVFWGNMVAASIALSSVVLAAVAAIASENSSHRYSTRNVPWWLVPIAACHGMLSRMAFVPRMIVLLPVAQLLPIVGWALAVGMPPDRPPRYAPLEEDDGAGGMGAREASDLINQEEEARRAGEASVVNNFYKSFEAHFAQHFMFYVETCVESVPQAIIQLAAMSSLGAATPLQLLSLSLSLFSIVSKGYVLSLSFDFKVFVWRFALAAHDIVSLFYLFSSVIAQGEPAEVALPGFLGGVSMSWVSWVIAMKLVFVSVVMAVWGLVMAAVIGIDCLHRGNVKMKDVWVFLGVVALCLVCFVPAVIAVEALKLSIISILISMTHSPSSNENLSLGTDVRSKLFSFIADSPNTASAANANGEVREGLPDTSGHSDTLMGRYRYVLWYLSSIIESSLTKTIANDYYGYIDWNLTQRRKVRKTRFMARANAAGDGEADLAEGSASLDRTFEKRPDVLASEHKDLAEARATRRLRYPFELWANFTLVSPIEDFHRMKKSDMAGVVLMFLFFSAITMDLPCAFLSLLYPLVHACYVGIGALNILQAFCLTLIVVSLTVAVALGQRGLLYTAFTLDLAHFPLYLQGAKVEVKDARRLVAKFHVPTAADILLSIVPMSVVPADVLCVTAAFLPSGAIVTKNLTAKEARAMKTHTSS